jgi:hypothetical protein
VRSVLDAVSPFPSPSPSRFGSAAAANGSAKKSLHHRTKTLDEEQAQYVANFLMNNPIPPPRITLNTPGKPRVAISMYAYNQDAPFKLVVEDHHPYIPKGQGADIFLLRQMIRLIHDNKESAVNTDKLATDLKLLLYIPDLKDRVVKVTEQASVLLGTVLWKSLDELHIEALHLQEIVNEIGACCDANRAAIKHLEIATKGGFACLETKFASVLTVTKKQISLDLTVTKTQVAHELTATKAQVAQELTVSKTQVAHELMATKTRLALL